MSWFLFILAILAFLMGVGSWAAVIGGIVIHEIAVFILFLMSAVLLSGAAIVDAINRLKKEIEKLRSNVTTTNMTVDSSDNSLADRLLATKRRSEDKADKSS